MPVNSPPQPGVSPLLTRFLGCLQEPRALRIDFELSQELYSGMYLASDPQALLTSWGLPRVRRCQLRGVVWRRHRSLAGKIWLEMLPITVVGFIVVAGISHLGLQ
jgi:hypothetical protein